MSPATLLILPLENVKPPGRKEMKQEKRFPCKFFERALKQINKGLRACGEKPISGLPLGIKWHPRQDVLGNALAPLFAPRGEPVGTDRVSVLKEFAESLSKAWRTQVIQGRPHETTADVLLPPTLKAFRLRFDREEFPELVQKP